MLRMLAWLLGENEPTNVAFVGHAPENELQPRLEPPRARAPPVSPVILPGLVPSPCVPWDPSAVPRESDGDVDSSPSVTQGQ